MDGRFVARKGHCRPSLCFRRDGSGTVSSSPGRSPFGLEAVQGFFVTGTDTDVGKTVVSAWLVAQLGACYWKPIQAGNQSETDSQIVQRLSGVSPDRILPEAYVLSEPIAPHEAARRERITVEMAKLAPPLCDRPLVVEGAGGLMVPLNDSSFVIDLARELELPLILVARSTLGTINHTLLSLEAIRRRGLPLAGVVMNGPETPHNRAAIERYGQVEVIAEIPWLDQVTPAALRALEPELDLKRLAKVAA